MKRLLIAFSIIVCSLQSPIFSSIFQTLNCDKFNEIETNFIFFVHFNFSVQCFTPYYFSWVYYYLLPNFIFYGVLLPLLSFVYTFSKRKNLYEASVLNHIGFLINGYKREKFYWEFIFFFRKLIFSGVITFLEPHSAALIILCLLFLSLLLQKSNKPFLTKKLNSFEYTSNSFCCFILILALLSESFEDEIVQGVCVGFMFFINCLFLLKILKILITFKLTELAKTKKIKLLRYLTEKLLKCNNYINFFFKINIKKLKLWNPKKLNSI